MQEKEWTRAFGWCNSWSTWARKSGRRNDHSGGKPDPGEARGHPGRSAFPTKGAPCSRLLQASIPLLPQFACSSFSAWNHHRRRQPSQAW
jgi:hypothetical protein